MGSPEQLAFSLVPAMAELLRPTERHTQKQNPPASSPCASFSNAPTCRAEYESLYHTRDSPRQLPYRRNLTAFLPLADTTLSSLPWNLSPCATWRSLLLLKKPSVITTNKSNLRLV